MAKRGRVVLKLNMDDLKVYLGKNLDEAMFEAALVVAAAVKSRAPVATGALAKSIYVSTPERSTYSSGAGHEKERKAGQGEVVVAVASYYAHFVEAGTMHRAAKPFFRPAFDATKAQAAARAAEVLRKGLEAA